MPTLSTMRIRTYGCPPQPFAITVLTGEKQGTIARIDQLGRPVGQRKFVWRGGGWRPASGKVLDQVIAWYVAQELPPPADPYRLDTINTELLAAGRQPAPVERPKRHEPCPDRQLPVADRA